MAIIFYQLAIIATLLFVRVAYPKLLLIFALVWSGLTVINLFFPPLIVIQLAVVWGTYTLIKPRRTSAPRLKPAVLGRGAIEINADSVVREKEPAPEVDPKRNPSEAQVITSPAKPSWAETARLSQFKAGVMLEATDRFSVPLSYAMEFMGDPNLLERLMLISADQERGGRPIEEQQLVGAKFIMDTWTALPASEKARLQAKDDLLDQIRI